MKFSPTAAMVAFLAMGSSAAYAQDAIVQGSGYQVSERTVLHPSIGAETGYVSNVFYDDQESVASAMLRILGTLAIAPMEDVSGKGGTPPDVTFSAGARFSYEEFLSGNDNVQAQRNLGLGVDLLLGFMPAGTFPITFEDHFIRTNRPTNFESNSTLNRDINSFKAGIGFQPQGRNLSARLHYTNTIDYFEGDGSAFANRLLNEFTLGIDWQFLPITRFYAEASYGINGGLGSESIKVSSNPMRGVLGVATAITERTTLRAHGGYAYGGYDAGASFSNPIYGVEGGFRYSPFGRVTLLFERDFRDSINANYFSDYMGKLVIDQQIERVLVQAHAAVRLRTYSGVPDIVGPMTTRDDFIMSTGAKASFELREWIALNASYDMQLVQTDFITMTAGDELDDPSFIRHQVMAGAAASF